MTNDRRFLAVEKVRAEIAEIERQAIGDVPGGLEYLAQRSDTGRRDECFTRRPPDETRPMARASHGPVRTSLPQFLTGTLAAASARANRMGENSRPRAKYLVDGSCAPSGHAQLRFS
jgi:hypothetical protein